MSKRTVSIELKCRPYQKPVVDFFRAGGRHAYECWHRRAGKDRVATFIESELAMKRVGLYWHALPEYKHARRVIWDNITKDGRKLLDANFPPEIIKRRHEQDMKIELVNGSIWQLVGSDNFDSLVGANPVHVTFSEFALNHPKAREFVRPILAENNGSELIITTPRGYNHAWKLWQMVRNDPRWHTSVVTVDDSKLLDAETLAAERREMPDELYRQEYYCDWSAANVGAIFGREIERAEKEGRMLALDGASMHDRIVVSSDIGYRDKASFWWWRVLAGGFELIDYDEGSGLDAEEWVERLRLRPRASMLYLPHDARIKTFQSKRTSIEIFLSANLADEVRISARSSKSDAINAGRLVLRRCRFDSERCAQGIEALRFYHYRYDDEQKIFSSEPEHDWSSHAADAFMEGAKMLSTLEPAPETKRIVVPPANRSFTLNQLWDTAPSAGVRRV
jgi:hypothetical protein